MCACVRVCVCVRVCACVGYVINKMIIYFMNFKYIKASNPLMSFKYSSEKFTTGHTHDINDVFKLFPNVGIFSLGFSLLLSVRVSMSGGRVRVVLCMCAVQYTLPLPLAHPYPSRAHSCLPLSTLLVPTAHFILPFPTLPRSLPLAAHSPVTRPHALSTYLS